MRGAACSPLGLPLQLSPPCYTVAWDVRTVCCCLAGTMCGGGGRMMDGGVMMMMGE